MRLQKAAVFVVHNRDGGTGRTVGGNSRESKYRLVIGNAQAFYGIQGFSSPYPEDHVRFLIQRHPAQLFHSLIGAVLSVQDFADDRQIRLFYIAADFVIGSSQSLFSSDYQDLFSIRFTYRSDLVINFAPNRIIGQMYFIIFQFHDKYSPFFGE